MHLFIESPAGYLEIVIKCFEFWPCVNGGQTDNGEDLFALTGLKESFIVFRLDFFTAK